VFHNIAFMSLRAEGEAISSLKTASIKREIASGKEQERPRNDIIRFQPAA
jgi:hypothetical protein